MLFFLLGGWFGGEWGIPGGSWRPWLYPDKVTAQTEAPGPDSGQMVLPTVQLPRIGKIGEIGGRGKKKIGPGGAKMAGK